VLIILNDFAEDFVFKFVFDEAFDTCTVYNSALVPLDSFRLLNAV
jgi:hypothetical protein